MPATIKGAVGQSPDSMRDDASDVSDAEGDMSRYNPRMTLIPYTPKKGAGVDHARSRNTLYEIALKEFDEEV